MVYYELALILVSVLTLLELRFGAKLDRTRILNLGIWGIRIAVATTLVPLVAFSVPYSLIDPARLPWVVGFAVYVLAIDFGSYVMHRAEHKYPILWKFHSLHHSDPDVNVTTNERQFWGEQFTLAVTVVPFAAFIIKPTPLFVTAYVLVAMWNYVSHARIPLNFGRLSWLINSPAYHRRHHSSLPEHFNSNFANIFPIFDVLFGTYNRPEKGMPPTGLGFEVGISRGLLWPFRG